MFHVKQEGRQGAGGHTLDAAGLTEGARPDALQLLAHLVGEPADGRVVEAESLQREEALILPDGLDYATVGGLSNEVREKLERIRPRTLGQAGRIEGMTPGALTALLFHVKHRRTAAA